jgi:hypothetical protein
VTIVFGLPPCAATRPRIQVKTESNNSECIVEESVNGLSNVGNDDDVIENDSGSSG